MVAIFTPSFLSLYLLLTSCVLTYFLGENRISCFLKNAVRLGVFKQGEATNLRREALATERAKLD